MNVIAVPVFPPNPNKRDSILMFCKIVNECNALIALTCKSYNYMKQLTSIKDFFITKYNKKSNISWPDNIQWIVTDTEIISNQKTKPKINIPESIATIIKQHRQKQQSTTNNADHNNDICFLQFTSGSTSDPKGVMITHSNLAHNLTIITNELKATSKTIVVSWLPQYHDMGLIGSYLGILYCNGTGYYMSPLTFLQNPSNWIEAISYYNATHLQAPNFAFKLTSRKFNSMKYILGSNIENNNNKATDNKKISINLSSVQHIINAAEPVDEESIQLFYKTFTPFGLKHGVIYPTYGLAEHTVFVCSGGKQIISINKDILEKDGIVNIVTDNDKADSTSIAVTRLVGCGYPSHHNVDVQIVNAVVNEQEPQQDAEHIKDDDELTKYQAVKEDIVGEIWIHSPSKAAGYYQKDIETKRDFYATLDDHNNNSVEPKSKSNSNTRYYLRTGDIGFFHLNELFICGRQKDLIIIGGRNYYPQDIEATAELILTEQIIRYGCSAAFTIINNSTNDKVIENEATNTTSEEVVLVMELRSEVISSNNSKDISTLCANYANQVRSSINQEHSLGISYIVFVNQRTVSKTSSGKIARAWCRKAYMNRTLQIIYEKSFKQQQDNSNTEQRTPLEIENEERPDGENNTASATAPSNTKEKSSNKSTLTALQIRALSKNEILLMIQKDISQVASIPISNIKKDVALATMMDSLTISQFKGMFEINYFINPSLSDDYLIRDSTSIIKLIEIVKLGYAPDDADDNGGGDNQNQNNHSAGGSGGLAGAMGCPPGVVCVIL